MSVPESNRRSPNAEPAYAALRQQIADGTKMPNERLVESDLIRDLGVSRGAVRNALIRLEQEGLVVREPNRGARVHMVTEDQAIEILQARSALEALAARHAAMTANDSEIAELRALLQEASVLLSSGDLMKYSDCNGRLHDKIVGVSHHGITQRLIAGLRAHLVRFQYRTILVPGRDVHSYAEHAAIVDAIAEHDPDRAERTMRAHMVHIADAVCLTPLAQTQRDTPTHTE
jgi:DNA-binding GntR family transcriptional regulator